MTIQMYDLFDPADYQRAVLDKLIIVRDDNAGLLIHNYSDAAMHIPGAWDNPAVRQCRGLITTDEGRIIARPWAKFFNHGQAESGALDMDAPVEVTDKMDGSLGIIHRALDGTIRVATRGSFQSDQAIHATKWLAGKGWQLAGLDRYTPLVEIIYPGNRIVCDYGDRDELVLLGAVDIVTGTYYGPTDAAFMCDWPGRVTDEFGHTTLRDALAAAPRAGAEGLCVRYLSEPRIVKIKQDDYVALHRIVTGLSERTIWQHMVNRKPLTSLLDGLPDELHDWTRSIWSNLDWQASVTESRALDAYHLILDRLPVGWTRRDFAEQAKQSDHAPLLFQLLDGRDSRPAILRALKPAGDTRAKTLSEATA